MYELSSPFRARTPQIMAVSSAEGSMGRARQPRTGQCCLSPGPSHRIVFASKADQARQGVGSAAQSRRTMPRAITAILKEAWQSPLSGCQVVVRCNCAVREERKGTVSCLGWWNTVSSGAGSKIDRLQAWLCDGVRSDRVVLTAGRSVSIMWMCP